MQQWRVGQSLQAFGNDRGALGAFSPFPSSPVRDFDCLLLLWRPPLRPGPRCFNGIIIALLAGRRLKINTFGQDNIQKQAIPSVFEAHFAVSSFPPQTT
ncbi:hypothetical protein LDENG_00131520 [Lucifuga dentata]|nr:hypothetical protein LDENG_00131520 [Lucifuga dentata]